MTLIAYLKAMPAAQRTAFAARCGTSFDYLRQIGYGNRPCSPLTAVSLERESNGIINRKGLFPDDWPKIWPELMTGSR